MGGTLALIAAAGAAAFFLLPRRRDPRFVRYAEAEVAGVRDAHAFRGKPLCQACHPHDDERLAGDPVALCASCHPGDHRTSHPVDVVQKKPPNPGLPLGEGGRVVCHTCHEAHDLARVKHGLRLPFSALCLRCHPSH
ncbi:MAG: cytochrome c3 family protein [Myxococcota bacterium]